MPSNPLSFGVLFVAFMALTITLLSVYVSRVYLPAKMKEAYRKSITALAAAVETKDSGTAGHAQRVAQLAADCALRLGVKGRNLERIGYAALLRDIGKANIPQVILNKTDPLTPDEWEMIQKHSELGEEMVAAVPFLADNARLVRHHHEYWDGTGYPDGLGGEDIPLGSRILAVASDLDAMMSQRPYHPVALSLDEALDQVRRDSGTKYDPAIVDVFEQVIRDLYSGDDLRRAA
jgi:HD-GYP domain-containing protein (c-di-GMP phosphodiesterase class II)